MATRIRPDDRDDPSLDRLDVAVDASLNRILRSSLRSETQIVIGGAGWAAFIASVRCGQDY